MKNQLHKDKKKRYLNLQNENKKFILKSISKNHSISKTIRWNSDLKFTSFLNNTSSKGLVNRCVFTGRKKKIHSNFNLSRLSFLKFARNGFISGLTKSTW
tara:strand:- start:111 stop:410 length:300 start_codon:yes stop_codon:yes gene_type:complete